jgi:hypothetical protein
MRRNHSIQGDLDLVCGLALLVEGDEYQKSNIKNQNDGSSEK